MVPQLTFFYFFKRFYCVFWFGFFCIIYWIICLGVWGRVNLYLQRLSIVQKTQHIQIDQIQICAFCTVYRLSGFPLHACESRSSSLEIVGFKMLLKIIFYGAETPTKYCLRWNLLKGFDCNMHPKLQKGRHYFPSIENWAHFQCKCW